MADLRVLQGKSLEVVRHTIEEQVVPFRRVVLGARLVLEPEQGFSVKARDGGGSMTPAGKDHTAQDAAFRRADMGGGQFAAAARGTLAAQHFIFDLAQDIVLEAHRRVFRALDDPHDRFELGKAFDPAVVIDPRDQPAGLFLAALQTRRRAVENVFADGLHKEVAPFLAAIIQRVVKRKQGVGFVAVDDAVAPTLAAQREHFVRRDRAVLRGGLGEVDKLGGHSLWIPL